MAGKTRHGSRNTGNTFLIALLALMMAAACTTASEPVESESGAPATPASVEPESAAPEAFASPAVIVVSESGAPAAPASTEPASTEPVESESGAPAAPTSTEPAEPKSPAAPTSTEPVEPKSPAAPTSTEPVEREPGVAPSAPSFQKTRAQLNEFYAAKGSTITARHKEVIEAELFAEDEIMAGDIVAARARIDAILEKYPFSDGAAWQGLGDPSNVWAGANNPMAYAGLRILDEVTRVALSGPPATSTPLQMTIIMPKCSTGQQPANKEMTETKPIYGQFSQRQLENNYQLQRQWFQKFQLYVWAITGGQRHLELEFFRWNECIEIGFDAPNLALSNKWWGRDMARVPREVHDRSDMYTFIYPVPADHVEGLKFLGGQGSFEGKMLMMGPDGGSIPKDPKIKGNSDVEQRLGGSYVVQHEFMHYFFLELWPEFNLEPSAHSWFKSNTWPADFVGNRSWEADYYYNALHRRFLGASNKPAQALSMAANTRQPVAQPIPGPK